MLMIQWFSSSLVRNLRPAHTCGGDNQLKWLPLYVRTLFRLFTHGVLAPPPVLLRNIIVTKVIAGLWAIFSFHLQSAAALVFAAALVETGAAQAWSSFLFIVKFTHTKKNIILVQTWCCGRAVTWLGNLSVTWSSDPPWVLFYSLRRSCRQHTHWARARL